MSASKKLAVFVIACMLAVWAASIPALAQNTDESDDDFIDDDSTTSITITDNSEDNDQFCAPVVNQYNNVVQGGANVLAGGDAVASVANQANVSNEVVINCINGDGNSVGGGSGSDSADDDTSDDGTSDDGDTGDDGTGDDGSNNGGDDGSDEGEETPVEDASCPGPATVVTIGPDETENRKVPFTTKGNVFRVSYAVEFADDDAFTAASIDVETRDGGLVEFINVFEDASGSYIVTDGAGEYNLVTNVRPDNGVAYSVTVDDCTGQAATNRSENTTPDIDTGVQSSVIDGTYDKDAVLAKTGGETVGLLQTGSLSALIPVGTFLMVVSMGLGVLLTSRSTRRG